MTNLAALIAEDINSGQSGAEGVPFCIPSLIIKSRHHYFVAHLVRAIDIYSMGSRFDSDLSNHRLKIDMHGKPKG
jgi:hypothetical protein